MKRNFSFIERFQFRYVLGFCLVLLAIDYLTLLRMAINEQIGNEKILWFNPSMGVLLILMAVTIFKYREEGIGVAVFGCSFILSSLAKLRYHPLGLIFLMFSVLLELSGIYWFWQAYNVCRQIAKETINQKKVLIKLGLFFVILLLPPVIFWFIGSK